MKIGVIIESFQKDLLSSLQEAKAIGADGIQLYAGNFLKFHADKKTKKNGGRPWSPVFRPLRRFWLRYVLSGEPRTD